MRLCLEEANLKLSRESGNAKELFLVYLQNDAYFMSCEENFLHFLAIMQNLLERVNSPRFAANSLDEIVEFLKK